MQGDEAFAAGVQAHLDKQQSVRRPFGGKDLDQRGLALAGQNTLVHQQGRADRGRYGGNRLDPSVGQMMAKGAQYVG